MTEKKTMWNGGKTNEYNEMIRESEDYYDTIDSEIEFREDLKERQKIMDKTRIKRRVIGQCPEKILAISKPVKDFKAWEKRLHKKYQENRVLKYEIFRNLTEKQISDIIEEIGGVNIDL